MVDRIDRESEHKKNKLDVWIRRPHGDDGRPEA